MTVERPTRQTLRYQTRKAMERREREIHNQSAKIPIVISKKGDKQNDRK